MRVTVSGVLSALSLKQIPATANRAALVFREGWLIALDDMTPPSPISTWDEAVWDDMRAAGSDPVTLTVETGARFDRGNAVPTQEVMSCSSYVPA